MSEKKLIVEVEVEDGLPGAEWKVEKDPRLLLAVAYELDKILKHNYACNVTGDKFIAEWEDGHTRLTLPEVNGDTRMLYFILMKTIEAMAKVLIEIEWGTRVMAELQAKVARAKLLDKGIAIPGQLVL